MAEPASTTIILKDATLVGGSETIDLGHFSGKSSPPKKVDWVVKAGAGNPTATVRVVSRKGGTDTEAIPLK
jgi:hypothetical protein